jgi:hypothetical protein
MEPVTHFTNHRDAALARLTHGERLNRNKGRFLGQLCAEPDIAPTEKMRNWLSIMLKEVGLPPLVN